MSTHITSLNLPSQSKLSQTTCSRFGIDTIRLSVPLLKCYIYQYHKSYVVMMTKLSRLIKV